MAQQFVNLASCEFRSDCDFVRQDAPASLLNRHHTQNQHHQQYPCHLRRRSTKRVDDVGIVYLKHSCKHSETEMHIRRSIERSGYVNQAAGREFQFRVLGFRSEIRTDTTILPLQSLACSLVLPELRNFTRDGDSLHAIHLEAPQPISCRHHLSPYPISRSAITHKRHFHRRCGTQMRCQRFQNGNQGKALSSLRESCKRCHFW